MVKPQNGPLTHIDASGAARMVDVSSKQSTVRRATARAVCAMNRTTAEAVRQCTIRKGDVLQVARIAAISAAKRTDELIPLCHSLPLETVQVEFSWVENDRLEILVTTGCSGKTGVEMEAMVGATLAALTVYDMCKSSDRELCIERVELVRKSGGASGEFVRGQDSLEAKSGTDEVNE